MTRKNKPEISTAELETMVLEAVAAAADTVSVRDIHRSLPKAFRPTQKALKPIVESLVDSNRLFRVKKRFSATAPPTLEQRILEIAPHELLTSKEIAKRLGVSSVAKAVKQLVKDGALHLRKQRSTKRYSTRPVSTAEKLQPLLAKFVTKTAKELEISEQDATRALRELLGIHAPAESDVILAAIRNLNPNADRGALTYLPHLRTAVAKTYKDKASFDTAVLRLLTRGAVELQSHPTPSLLSAAERDAMIEDGRGGYFTAIGLR